MSLYKYYITHNSVTTEVHPSGFIDSDIVEERYEGQFFTRKNLNGQLIFNNVNVYSPGETPTADYTLLKAIEQGLNKCLEVVIDIEKSCDGGNTYGQYWSGYFNVNDGEWNSDRCSVTFKKFEPNDAYRCIISKIDEEINILSASPIVETSALLVTDYEFSSCTQSSGTCTTLHPSGDGWLLFHIETIDGVTTRIYYREKAVTGCLGGAVNPPSGAGWVLISNDCATTGLATYARTPVTVVTNNPNPNVSPGNCEDDGSGGYNSAYPPRAKTLSVSRTNTPITSEIIGYDKGYASVSGYNEKYTFKIKNPNAASSYTWSGTNITIITGQGTDTVEVKFTNTGTLTLQVVETTICSTAAAITKNITVVSAGDLSPLVINYTAIGVTDVCKTQAGVIFKMPTLPELFTDSPTWTVGTGATIISGQGTDTIEVDFNASATGTVSIDFDVNNISTISGGAINGTLTVNVSNAARTPDINGLDSVCPNTQDLTYTIQNRSGASYLWSITGGTIVSGQGTNSVVVDWANSVGSGSITVQETINCGCTYILVGDCGTSGEPSFYWCPESTSGTEVLYDQNRTLYDALTLFSDACDLTEVQSDYFDMNPVGDAPDYVAGNNYVTGAINKVNHIHIAQKSDIIDPGASNPATRGMMTFTQMTEMLKTIFNVYWFIDGTNLRFEHYKYFVRTANPNFNLTDVDKRQWIIGKNKYSYEKAKMPKYERFKWSEAANTDFIGFEIRYDSSCVNLDSKSNVLNYSPGNVTTDILFINSDPTEINKEGFVLIANDLVGSTYVVQSEEGLITGLIKPNAHLSWANLHYNYHRHGRVLLEGSMNNQVTTFLSAKRAKKQADIKFPFCCDDELLPLTELVTTYLGSGEIDKMSLSIKNNMITTDLLHDI
jgi:hypothetical protein